MRIWIVSRRRIAGEPRRVATLVSERLPERLSVTMPGVTQPVALDVRLTVEPAPNGKTWLVLVGAFPVPHGPAGPAVDVDALRRAAQAQALTLLTALAEQLEWAAAPLPGVEPEAEPQPRALVVRDVMDADPPVVDESLALPDVVSLLAATGAEGAPVVTAQGRLIGVLTGRDLLSALLRQPVAPAEQPPTAGQLCTRPPMVTVPDLPARKAAQQLLFHGVHQLVVIQGGRLAGMVSRDALFRALWRHESGGVPADRVAEGAPLALVTSGRSRRPAEAMGPDEGEVVGAPWAHGSLSKGAVR